MCDERRPERSGGTESGARDERVVGEGRAAATDEKPCATNVAPNGVEEHCDARH